MKTLIKTKLLEGKYLELREYEMFKVPLKVIHCTADNYKCCKHIGEGFQLFTVAQQHKGKITNTQQSQFPPYAYYRMYKFLYRPSGKIQPEEEIISPSLAMAQNIDKNREVWEKVRILLHSK